MAKKVVSPDSQNVVENITDKPENKQDNLMSVEAVVPQDNSVLELLKKFPNYDVIYVNRLGGTYSYDTAASIRGDAVLYKNPFYTLSEKEV